VPAVQTRAVPPSPVPQLVPSAVVGFEHAPVAALQTPAWWHASLAWHTTAAPPHVPLVHTSDVVHLSWSSHAVPSAAFGLEQAPVLGSHVPAAWHWSLAVQTTGFDPVHAPAWHWYSRLHLSVPMHGAPSGLGTCAEHAPVDGLHVPGSLHWSLLVQTTGSDPTQRPALHASSCVQALPSLHATPFATGTGAEHRPVVLSHVPGALHWSPPPQTTGFAPTQAPALQLSVCVHGLLSVQAVPSVLGTGAPHWPVVGLHVPAPLHWSPLVHTTGFDPVHFPDWQESVCVQAFPSEQLVPLAFGTSAEHWPVDGLQVPAVLH
jgi:hypothetical protein